MRRLEPALKAMAEEEQGHQDHDNKRQFKRAGRNAHDKSVCHTFVRDLKGDFWPKGFFVIFRKKCGRWPFPDAGGARPRIFRGE